MRTLIYLVVLSLSLVMTGCKINEVKGEVGDVEVEAKTKDSDSNHSGEFCPPGQAKKGNC